MSSLLSSFNMVEFFKKQKVTSSLQQNQNFVKVCFWAPRPSRLIIRF